MLRCCQAGELIGLGFPEGMYHRLQAAYYTEDKRGEERL